jgi:nicotinamidase/pyrazinamidase
MPVKAFFDIDTQIDFLFPAGALYTQGAEKVIPAVAKLNRYAFDHGIPVISSTCAHTEDAAEFKVWPPHCIVDTIGQKKPSATLMPGGQHIIEKNELDLFSNPELIPLLDSLGIEEAYVYGVLTEYCVKHAIMGLLKTGRKVYLVTDAIHHQSEEAARQVIADFTAAGGICVSTSSVSTSHLPNTAPGGDSL